MISERIQVFILLEVENDRSAAEVVTGLTSKSLHMWTVHALFSGKFLNLRHKEIKAIHFLFAENNTKNISLDSELRNIYFVVIYSFYVLWLIRSVFTFDCFQ